MHSITVLDSRIGAGAMASVSKGAEYKHHSSHMYDSFFYGNSDSPDCPVPGTQCNEFAKTGITTSI
jgi:hypothetical protein